MILLNGLWEWIASTELSQYIHESPAAFPTIECVHVLAICLVFGTILNVDLRLLGFASTQSKITALTREVLPLTWTAFVLAVITGTLLFISQPVDYAANLAFNLKMLALAAAGLNMAVFHLGAFRTVAAWDADAKPPRAARVAAAVSLVCWLAVIACGRTIGFTMFPG